LESDRFLSADIEAVSTLLRDRTILDRVEKVVGKLQ
jgi:hypothetical protein